MQNTVVSSNYPVPRAITFAKFQFRERVDHALAISCEKPSWWKALSPRGTRTVEKVQQRAKKGTIDAPASFLVFLEFSRATAVGLLSPSPTHCLSLRAATHARMREFIDDTSCVCTRARAHHRGNFRPLSPPPSRLGCIVRGLVGTTRRGPDMG